MKILSFLILILGIRSFAQVKPHIACKSDSPNVKVVDIYFANFKDVPDIFTGDLPKCTFNTDGEGLSMSVTYPAQGTTVTYENGSQKTFWMAAVVVDGNNQPTIYYQYSDFVVRNLGLSNPSPCTQGLFISDNKAILDFASNEPRIGMGRARLNSETITLICK